MPEPGAVDGVETLRQAAQRGHSAHLAPEEVRQVLERLRAAESVAADACEEHRVRLLEQADRATRAELLLKQAEDYARDAGDRAEHAEQVAGELYEAARRVSELFGPAGDDEQVLYGGPDTLVEMAGAAARVRRLREELARQGDHTSDQAGSLEVGRDVASRVATVGGRMCEECWKNLGSPTAWNYRTANALVRTRMLYALDTAGGPMRLPLAEWLEGCECPRDEVPEAGAQQWDEPVKAFAEDLRKTLRKLDEYEKASVLAFYMGYAPTPVEAPTS